MVSLVSSEEAVAIRADLSVFLVHTYSRTPRTVDTVNDDGSTTYTYDMSSTPDIPCQYQPAPQMDRDVSGRTTVNSPVLLVAWDDESVPGDLINNIRNEEGALLIASNLYVETVIPNADFGPVLDKVITLAGAAPVE